MLSIARKAAKPASRQRKKYRSGWCLIFSFRSTRPAKGPERTGSADPAMGTPPVGSARRCRSLVSRRNPRAGLVNSCQTFVCRCHGSLSGGRIFRRAGQARPHLGSADSLRPECGPSFHRDIDFGDWEALALEHEPYLFGRDPRNQHSGASNQSAPRTLAVALEGVALLQRRRCARASLELISDAATCVLRASGTQVAHSTAAWILVRTAGLFNSLYMKCNERRASRPPRVMR
jgi:hypothetical protein